MSRAAAPDARRSVVPAQAGRSLWLAAAWTGAGAVVVCATSAIVAVAICWLPVSDGAGRAAGTIRAGLLTFLAGLHGGVTVDGLSAAFLPLGMLALVLLACVRAGAALADTAAELGERDPVRLAVAGLAQVAAFTVACLLLVPFATLGTSGVSFPGVTGAAALVALLGCGVGLVRACPLRGLIAARLPSWTLPAARAGAAALAVFLGAGALLVAGSLVVHHERTTALVQATGSGWGAVPVLALTLFAVPNAVVAGAAYLIGPGFALGGGVSPFAVGANTLPAFPILGAVPDTPRGGLLGWLPLVIVALLAGFVLAGLAGRAPTWAERARHAAAGIALAALALAVLCWQAGGGIGADALATIGPSPLLVPLALAGELAAVTALCFGVRAVRAWLRRDSSGSSAGSRHVLTAVTATLHPHLVAIAGRAKTTAAGAVAADSPGAGKRRRSHPGDEADGGETLAG